MKVAEEFIRALYAIRDAINGNNGESCGGSGNTKDDLNLTYPVGVYRIPRVINISPSVEITEGDVVYETLSDEQKQAIRNSEFISFKDLINNIDDYSENDMFIPVYDKISDNIFNGSRVQESVGLLGGIINTNQKLIYKDYITDKYFIVVEGHKTINQQEPGGTVIK